ncbi:MULTISPECIES: FUSC family protein [unclassified Streptomyces]|uniref:FUSC family protein n=1 Tax=unclassified Streptomyces TaxID=2593676 RepID=UPI002DD82062|nr:FUSC family protein [Streptomyces sp. NBC_01445]WSE03117.1 FUSC family protein [Streptomyces sp. NBC_01445]
MPSSRRPLAAVTRHGWRHAVTSAVRLLSPRGSLALQRADGAPLFAVRGALAMALVALPVAIAGRPDLSVYAMLGAFTTTFGRNLPYPRRARVLALVAVAMTACVGCGSALAAWVRPGAGGWGAAVVVAATAVVAGLAKLACDATRLSGLGAVLLLFSFAVAANGSPTTAEVLPQTGLAAAGAAVAWVLGVSGWLVHPDRPQRYAVARALRELAGLLTGPGPGGDTRQSRHRTTVAVLQAYHSLGIAPPTQAHQAGRDGVFVRLTDLSWSLLISSARRAPVDPAATAEQLLRQARVLTERRRRPPVLLPELAVPPPAAQDSEAAVAASASVAAAGPAAGPGRPVAWRATELLMGRRAGGPEHRAVLAVPAVRMVLGTGIAGGLAVAGGLEHSYWASISAAAVLHSVNLRTTAQRAVQRTLGTVIGLLLALGVLATDPRPVALACVIVLLEFLLEYFVPRNYGLGVVFLTPLALLMSDLAAPAPAGELVADRVLGSVLGIVVGLGCALLVVHDHAALRVERALAACTQASDQAERSLAESSGPQLPVVQVQLVLAVVELRDADDAAAGELWPAGIDPAELAAAEQRAYLLLERLHHRR